MVLGTTWNNKRHMSLKAILMLLLMSMALLPIAANISISFPQILKIIESAQRQDCIASLKESYFAFDKKLAQRKESVRLLSGVPGIRDFLSGRYKDFSKAILVKRLEGLIDMWFANEMDVNTVALIRTDGHEKLKLVRNNNGKMQKIPDKDLGWDKKLAHDLSQEHMADRKTFIVRIADIIRCGDGFHTHEPVAQVAAIIKNYSGAIAGLAIITMDISNLLIQSHFDFLATGTGHLISSIGPDAEKDPHHPGDLFLRFPGMKEAMEAGNPIILKDRNGGEVAWFPILPHKNPSENLWAGRRVNESLAKNLKAAILSRIAGVSAIALILVLIIVERYSYKIDRYRKELVEALQSLLLGQGAVELNWKGPIEIEELSKDLNELFKKFIDNDLKRREAIAKLSDLNTRMRMILDNAVEGIIEINRQNKITFANRSACRILGFSRDELVDNDLHSIIHYLKKGKGQPLGEDCPFCTTMKNGHHHHLFREDVFWTHNQKPIHVEYVTAPVKDHEGKIIGMVMCLRDVSARKTAEDKARIFQEQLRQAQKMEAIGTLAGGIAHDFNNLLTAVRGYAELLEFDLKGDKQALQQLKNIREAADRAASLVRQLLAFSRKQAAEKHVIDVNRLVTEQRNMLKRIIGEDVTLEIATCEGEAFIYADPNMVAQVIMNMVVNARDALSNSLEKRIEIRVENKPLSPETSIKRPDLRPGRYVILTISDTGSGMDKHVLERIFDPFFTTKDMDKGTGLGLAVAYGIVEQHGGWIECTSEPGKGATFKIFFPEHEDDSPHTVKKKGRESIAGNLFANQIGRGITAFVLEDDSMVLSIIKDMLEAMGFNVIPATSIEEANYLIGRIGQDIELVVSDVILPDGNGIDFVEQILIKKPDTPVLLLSGYIDEKLHMEKIKELKIPFLSKPFRISDIHKAISKILKSHNMDQNL